MSKMSPRRIILSHHDIEAYQEISVESVLKNYPKPQRSFPKSEFVMNGQKHLRGGDFLLHQEYSI